MPLPTQKMFVRREVEFAGRVQGVGFRCTAQNIAMQYDVVGYVRNTPAGQVELVMEGCPTDLEQIVSDIKQKMGGFIQNIRWHDGLATHEFKDFSIRH